MRILALSCLIAVGCASSAKVVSSPTPPSAAPPREGAPLSLPEQVARAQAAIALHPDDLERWHELTSALRRLNRLPEALRAAWRAVELQPDYASWNNLGNVLIQGNAGQGAWAAFEKAAEHVPPQTSAQSFLNLGYRLWIAGADEAALRAYDRALQAVPDSLLAFYDRAFLFSSQRKQPEATAAAQRCLTLLEPRLAGASGQEREAYEIMKAFLGKIVAGERMQRPPPIEGEQDLPERLWRTQPAPGKALALELPSRERRIYGVNRTLIGFLVQSATNEEVITQEIMTIKWSPSDGEPPRWKMLLSFAPIAEHYDIQAATLAAMRQVNKGRPDLALTRVALKDGEAFWFWAEDPGYDASKPTDYRFAAQLFGRTGPIGFTVTLLTNDTTGRVRDGMLELVKSAETHALIE